MAAVNEMRRTGLNGEALLRPHREAGFSTPQLLGALALTGLLLGQAVTNLPHLLAAYDLSNATMQVASDLRRARMRAITQNLKERVTFRGDGYVLQHEQPAGSEIFVDESALMPLPSTVTVVTEPESPVFDSRGLVQSSHLITLTTPYGGTKTITVTAIGRVELGDVVDPTEAY